MRRHRESHSSSPMTDDSILEADLSDAVAGAVQRKKPKHAGTQVFRLQYLYIQMVSECL